MTDLLTQKSALQNEIIRLGKNHPDFEAKKAELKNIIILCDKEAKMKSKFIKNKPTL